jgi:hypothetical protein
MNFLTNFTITKFCLESSFCSQNSNVYICQHACIFLVTVRRHTTLRPNHEILKPAISGFYIRFHSVYRPCYYFTRKQMTPFYWQQKLPENREYIKIQECIQLWGQCYFCDFLGLKEQFETSCYRFSCYYRFSDM